MGYNSRIRKDSCSNSFFVRFLNRFLITALLTVVCLIFLKKNVSFKNYFSDHVLSDNFNFSYFNSLYDKYLGGFPFKSVVPVFNEKLSYSDSSDYLDGVSLSVSSDYLVPSMTDGLVVFIGYKEGYGNTLILEGSDGVDIWYSNMDDISVSMYEYVGEGSFIGNCSDKLILVFKKDGNVLDYKKYI